MDSSRFELVHKEQGTVTLEQRGLYYAFRSDVFLEREGFCRLHYHTENRSVRIGLFCRGEDRLSCTGSISARQLGLEETGVFSVTEEPWLPLREPLDGGMLPAGALCRREGDCRIVAVPDKAELPCEIMPFFCFLTPEIIEGLPCLSFLADRQGRPVVPEIIS